MPPGAGSVVEIVGHLHTKALLKDERQPEAQHAEEHTHYVAHHSPRFEVAGIEY